MSHVCKKLLASLGLGWLLLGTTTNTWAVDPILVLEAPQFETTSPLPELPLQGIEVPRNARAVNIDGSLNQSVFWGMSVQGNPWQDGLARSGGAGLVRLNTGAFSPTEVDFGLPTKGPAIPIGRTFDSSGSMTSNANTLQGWNWHQAAWPELVTSGDYVYISFGGDRFLEFKETETDSDTFRGINGVAGAVVRWVYDAKTTTYVVYSYYDNAGNRMDFFGEGVQHESVPIAGRMWRMVDGADQMAHVGASPTAGDDPKEAIDSGFDASGRVINMLDGAGRLFEFAYASDRLASVTVSLGTLEIGSVEYAYYGSGDANGLPGDLKLVTVRTRMSPTGTALDSGPELVRKTYYRYWINATHSSATPGHQHLVRMIVDAEGFRRFDADPRTGSPALNVDINLVEDSQLNPTSSALKLDPFATVLLEYGTDRKVSKTTLPGEATSSNTIAEYWYGVNTAFGTDSGTAYDVGWTSRTFVKDSATSWSTFYFDEANQSLGLVLTDGKPVTDAQGSATFVRSWNTDVRRNASAQIDRIATPASMPLSSIAPTDPTRHGQVFVIGRISSHFMQGFVRSIKTQKGGVDSSSNPFDAVYLSSAKYLGETGMADELSLTVGDFKIVRPLIASTRRYDIETATDLAATSHDAPTTQFSYVAYSDSLALQQIVTTPPPVAADRFGDGLDTWQRKSYFAADGLVEFTRSPTGRINYFQYDAVTGRVSRSVQDANTSSDLASSVTPPDGYASTTTSGVTLLRRVREYAYDNWGRLTRTKASDGKMSAMLYSRLKDQRPVVLDIPWIDSSSMTATIDKWSGPAQFTALTLDGAVSATMVVSAARTGWQDQKVTYESSEPPLDLIDEDTAGGVLAVVATSATDFSRGMLSENVYTSNGRQLIGVQRTTKVDGGVTHIDTRLSYDSRGRLYTTRTPAGTFDWFDYDDATSQLLRTWKGILDDGSVVRRVQTSEYVFDNNQDGGNGLLTSSRRFTMPNFGTTDPDDVLSDLTTYFYDYRGRPVGVHNPAAPHQLTAYDNQSRVKRVGLLATSTADDWDDEFMIEAADGGQGLSSLRALAEWNFDERGRVFHEKRFNVNQFDGSIGGSGQPDFLSQMTLFGPEGSVRATVGSTTLAAGASTTTKYERNRACEVTKMHIIAQSGSPADYTEASKIVASDYVLRETQYAIETSTGRVNGVISIERGPQPDSCLGSTELGMALFPSNFLTVDEGGFWLNATEPTTGGALPFGGTVEVGMIWYDKIGRPRLDAEWNFKLGEVEEWPFPLEYEREFDNDTSRLPAWWGPSRANGLDFDDLLPARVRTKYYNELGLLENESGPDGSGRFTLYDFAGRPTGWGSSMFDATGCEGSGSPPYGSGYDACRPTPSSEAPPAEGWQDFDDDGRLHCVSIVYAEGHVIRKCGIFPDYGKPGGFDPSDPLPTNIPFVNPSTIIWAGDAANLARPFVYSNDLPIGYNQSRYTMVTSDPWPDSGSNYNHTWISYDIQGRPIQYVEPHRTKTTVSYDPMGRIREQQRVLLDSDSGTSFPKYKRTKTSFDGLGRPVQFEDFDYDTTNPNSRVKLQYDAFGNPLGMFTELFPEGGGDPILGMAVKQKFDLRDLATTGFSPWGSSLIVPTSIELPGGMALRPRYGTCNTTATPLSFLTDYGINGSTFDPDAMLGRVTSMEFWPEAPAQAMAVPGFVIDPNDVKPILTKPPLDVTPPFMPAALRQGYLGIAYPEWFETPVWSRPTHNLQQPQHVCCCTIPNVFDPNAPSYANRWGEPTLAPWEYCAGISCNPRNPTTTVPWQEDKTKRHEHDGGIDEKTICAGFSSTCNPTITIDAGGGTPCEKKEIQCSGMVTEMLTGPPPATDGEIVRNTNLEIVIDDETIPPTTLTLREEKISAGRISQLLRSYYSNIAPGYQSYDFSVWTGIHAEQAVEQTTTFTYSEEIEDAAHPNRLASYTRVVTSPSGTTVHEVDYDSRGNLIDDGQRFFFEYDVDGNLTDVYDRVLSTSGLTVVKGNPRAKFRYDVLGRRISAVYNLVNPAIAPSTSNPDAAFDDDYIEYYGYDDRWRLVSVWRQNVAGSLDVVSGENAASGERPTPALYERILHRYTGSGGTGQGWFLDAPVLAQVNTDWQTDVYGDDLSSTDPGDGEEPGSDNDLCPKWEIVRQYMQSAINGDIIGVYEQDASPGDDIDIIPMVDRLDYSMFGLPLLKTTNGLLGTPINADVDDDGVITNGLHPDGGVDINDLLSMLALFEAGDPRGDIADGNMDPFPDGGVDINDLIRFSILYEEGQRTTTTDRRFGWRGYQWDKYLGLYHVRNRVFDPKLMHWLQPDPLGEIDGPNIYAYVGWDPFNKVDPMGLSDWMLTRWLGLDGTVAGGFADGAIDGAVIVGNQLTFKTISTLDEESQRLRADNGWEHEAADWAGATAREAILWAATAGTAGVARGGVSGTSASAQLINALAKSKSTVQGARILVAALSAYTVGSGSYAVGNGLSQIIQGDNDGWWDIGFGILRAAGGFLGARDVRYYLDKSRSGNWYWRPLQDNHYVPRTSRGAEQARIVFARYGIDINDLINRGWGPQMGRHPARFDQWVVDTMIEVDRRAQGNVSRFRELFNELVAEPVRRNPDMLRKCYWE